MNDHNLDDLIIDTIQPNNSKAKSFLTIIALFIVVLIVGIILAKSYSNNTDNAPLAFDDNSSVTIAPELKLQEPEKVAEPKDEPSLANIIEEKITEPEAPKEPVKVEEPKPVKEAIVTPVPEPKVETKTSLELPPTEPTQTHTTPAVVKPEVKKPTTPKLVIKKPVVHTPKATPLKKYYVQVGSFKQNPSPRFLSVIKSSGFRYLVSKPDAIGNKKLLIGPYKTRADVDKALKVVRDRIHKSAFVVQK